MKGSLIAAGFTVAGALMFVTPQPDDKPITLTRTYKAGEITRYNSTMRVKALGNEFVQESVDKIEIIKVDPDGSATATYGQESGSYTLNGKKNDLPKSPAWTITRDKYNRFVKASTEETLEFFIVPDVRRLLFACIEVVFPERPVKVGESWTTELDNPAVKGKKVTLKTTLRGEEIVDGFPVYKLAQHTEADTNLSGGKLTSDLVAWLTPSTGEAVKIEASFKGVPTQAGALETTSTSVRIKLEAKDKLQ
jgi:hypothetical protein